MKTHPVKLTPRERILAAATELFYAHGIHTVGIDRIIKESQVAKMTFYNHFESKSKLVVAYLERQSDAVFANLEKATSVPGVSETERVLGIFDFLEMAFSQKEFHGCPFIKGLSEFGGSTQDREVKRCIARHFERLLEFVEALLKPLKIKGRKKTANKIVSLINGSIVFAQMSGNSSIAKLNRETALMILNQS